MWYVIIGVIVVLIIMTRTDKKEKKEKISKKGGIKQMYPVLFNHLLSDDGSRIVKESLDVVEISWNDRSSSARFWVKLAYDKLMITWTFKNKFSDTLKANWSFSSNMNQNQMIEQVTAEISYKINNMLHLSDFEDNVQTAVDEVLNIENDSNHSPQIDHQDDLFYIKLSEREVQIINKMKLNAGQVEFSAYRNEIVEKSELMLIVNDALKDVKGIITNGSTERNKLVSTLSDALPPISNETFDRFLSSINSEGIDRAKEKELVNLAKDGDSKSKYNLGSFYNKNSPFDLKALTWYLLAIDDGEIDAMSDLGIWYLNHNKFKDAYLWFKSAAIKDNSFSQFHLGKMYLMDFGWGIDKQEAKKWIRKAYDNNDIQAQILCSEHKWLLE